MHIRSESKECKNVGRTAALLPLVPYQSINSENFVLLPIR